MDFDTFTNASFFLQGRADQFAQKNPTERKKILGSILGLDIWDAYNKKAAEKRK
jgi:exonuclease SbcC